MLSNSDLLRELKSAKLVSCVRANRQLSFRREMARILRRRLPRGRRGLKLVIALNAARVSELRKSPRDFGVTWNFGWPQKRLLTRAARSDACNR